MSEMRGSELEIWDLPSGSNSQRGGHRNFSGKIYSFHFIGKEEIDPRGKHQDWSSRVPLIVRVG